MTVMIGVDPHKATHTAVAIDGDERPLARLRLVAGRCRTQRLLAGAEPLGAERTWAVESAGGWASCWRSSSSVPGELVVDVAPTLAARVRLLGSIKASKNDPNDALATAIAGLGHCGLRAVRVEDHTAVVRMVIDRYHDLVALRTQAPVGCTWRCVSSSLAARLADSGLTGPPSCYATSTPRGLLRLSANVSLSSC
jgi:transposase